MTCLPYLADRAAFVDATDLITIFGDEAALEAAARATAVATSAIICTLSMAADRAADRVAFGRPCGRHGSLSGGQIGD